MSRSVCSQSLPHRHQRKKQKLDRIAKEVVREEFQKERVRSTRVITNDRPRRFKGYGYSDEPYVEVEVPRSPKPLTFKNKIEEYLWRSKNN